MADPHPMPQAPISVPRPWPNLAAGFTVALIVMGLAWELVIDPIRPGGSWLALKVVPLLFGIKGMVNGRLYTFKWMSLLIWVYVGEALVRIVGMTPMERTLAWISLVLSVGAALAILLGARACIRQQRDRASAADTAP